MRICILALIASAAFAQVPIPGPFVGGSGGGSSVCTLSGTQTTGYVLTASDNGSACSWAAVAGTGTVTSVGLAGTANQITVTGASPITGAGSWTLTLPSALLLPGTINKLTLTTPATGATLTLADGKTFTASNTLTLAGTDGSTLNVGAGGTLAAVAVSGSASDLSAGTLAAARGGAGSITGALKANGSGAVSQAACADLSNASASCATDATNASNIGSGTLAAARIIANVRARGFGALFDGGGSAISNNKIQYFTVPYACTISAWNATVDSGTITFDVWKIGTGSAIPTVTNTIVASAAPAIASGTALHSTTLTGWTTSVTANDIFGIKVTAISGATLASLVLQCDQ